MKNKEICADSDFYLPRFFPSWAVAAADAGIEKRQNETLHESQIFLPCFFSVHVERTHEENVEENWKEHREQIFDSNVVCISFKTVFDFLVYSETNLNSQKKPTKLEQFSFRLFFTAC